MPPVLNDDALGPGATQPMSTTQLVLCRQDDGAVTQKQPETEEPPDVHDQVHQEEQTDLTVSS